MEKNKKTATLGETVQCHSHFSITKKLIKCHVSTGNVPWRQAFSVKNNACKDCCCVACVRCMELHTVFSLSVSYSMPPYEIRDIWKEQPHTLMWETYYSSIQNIIQACAGLLRTSFIIHLQRLKLLYCSQDKWQHIIKILYHLLSMGFDHRESKVTKWKAKSAICSQPSTVQWKTRRSRRAPHRVLALSF